MYYVTTFLCISEHNQDESEEAITEKYSKSRVKDKNGIGEKQSVCNFIEQSI